jgi:hypothetical protein
MFAILMALKVGAVILSLTAFGFSTKWYLEARKSPKYDV